MMRSPEKRRSGWFRGNDERADNSDEWNGRRNKRYQKRKQWAYETNERTKAGNQKAES